MNLVKIISWWKIMVIPYYSTNILASFPGSFFVHTKMWEKERDIHVIQPGNEATNFIHVPSGKTWTQFPSFSFWIQKLIPLWYTPSPAREHNTSYGNYKDMICRFKKEKWALQQLRVGYDTWRQVGQLWYWQYVCKGTGELSVSPVYVHSYLHTYMYM